MALDGKLTVGKSFWQLGETECNDTAGAGGNWYTCVLLLRSFTFRCLVVRLGKQGLGDIHGSVREQGRSTSGRKIAPALGKVASCRRLIFCIVVDNWCQFSFFSAGNIELKAVGNLGKELFQKEWSVF